MSTFADIIFWFQFDVERAEWYFSVSLLHVPDVENCVSEFLDVLFYCIHILLRGHIFENYLEASFLLRFVGVEFSVSDFELELYFGLSRYLD